MATYTYVTDWPTEGHGAYVIVANDDMGTELSSDGTSRLFASFVVLADNGQINLTISTPDGSQPADLSDEWETHSSAILLGGGTDAGATNGNSAVFQGPNERNSVPRDADSVYTWIPGNVGGINTLAQYLEQTGFTRLRIVFEDGARPPDFGGRMVAAQTWDTATDVSLTVPFASGHVPPTYSASGLPDGLTFDPETRIISGRPRFGGVGTITITATNRTGSADLTIEYTIAFTPAAPVFADDTGDPHTFVVGRPFGGLVVPEPSGHPPPTFTVRNNSLPAGFTFNAETRVISGTPEAAGSGTIRIRATNTEGNDEWTVAYTVLTAIDTSLQIDWDGDGSFSHTYADVTADIVPGTLRAKRGRDYTGQIINRAVAGRLTVNLLNHDGKYTPLNAASPLNGLQFVGRQVRWRYGTNTLWTGYLDEPRFVQRPGGADYVVVTALGIMSTIRRQVSVAQLYTAGSVTARTTGEAAQAVAAAAGVAGTHLRGGKSMPRWWVKDRDALGALRDIEETEEGFLFERGDGLLEMQSEDERSTGSFAVSAVTLAEAGGTITVIEAEQNIDIKALANTIRVPVRQFAEGTEARLWQANQNLTVQPSATVTLRVTYPNAGSPSSHAGVSAWTEPVAPTDFTAQNGLAVTSETDEEDLVIRLTNSSGSAITLTSLQARGIPIVATDPLIIDHRDAQSITDYQERLYPDPAVWLQSLGQGLEYAASIIRRTKDPRERMRVTYLAFGVEQYVSLELSRRITVSYRGRTRDWHIEGVSFAEGDSQELIVEWILSPVLEATVPSAPLPPTIAAASRTSVTITWPAPYNGGSVITGYNLQHRAVGSEEWIDVSRGANQRALTVTGLEVGAYHEARVQAINAEGTGTWSEVGRGRTAVDMPSAPTDLTITAETISAIRATWMAPADDGGSAITDYDVQCRVTGTDDWEDCVHEGGATFSVITADAEGTPLVQGESYDVRVRAVNESGAGGWSAVASGRTVSTEPGRPAAPDIGPAQTDSETSLTITWTAPFDGGSAITGYSIRVRQTDTSAWRTLTQGNILTRTVTGLEPRTEYEAQVAAINTHGVGDFSPSGTSTTGGDVPDAPRAPTVVRGAAAGSLGVSWTAPDDNGLAITGYNFRYRQVGTSRWSPLTFGATTTAHTLTGLAAGTSYEVQIAARNSVGLSNYSLSRTASTAAEVYGAYVRDTGTVAWQDWAATANYRGSGLSRERQYTRSGTRSGIETSTSNYGNVRTRSWSVPVSETEWRAARIAPVISNFAYTARSVAAGWDVSASWDLNLNGLTATRISIFAGRPTFNPPYTRRSQSDTNQAGVSLATLLTNESISWTQVGFPGDYAYLEVEFTPAAEGDITVIRSTLSEP